MALTVSLFSGVCAVGQPSTCTYRKPWYVNVGSHVCVLLPESTRWSVCFAVLSGAVAISPFSRTGCGWVLAKLHREGAKTPADLSFTV